jgi:hypothetical protein
MEATAADDNLFALLRRSTQEARKPGEGDTEGRPSLRSTHMLSGSKRTLVGLGAVLSNNSFHALLIQVLVFRQC